MKQPQTPRAAPSIPRALVFPTLFRVGKGGGGFCRHLWGRAQVDRQTDPIFIKKTHLLPLWLGGWAALGLAWVVGSLGSQGGMDVR